MEHTRYPKERKRSATTNAEREKNGGNKGRWIFVQIRQNNYQSFKIQFMCLQLNVSLACQRNPGFIWYRER